MANKCNSMDSFLFNLKDSFEKDLKKRVKKEIEKRCCLYSAETRTKT